MQLWCLPCALPDGADGAATGQRSQRSHAKAAFTHSLCPSLVAAKSLSVCLTKESTLDSKQHHRSRESLGAVSQKPLAIDAHDDAHFQSGALLFYNRQQWAKQLSRRYQCFALTEPLHPCRGVRLLQFCGAEQKPVGIIDADFQRRQILLLFDPLFGVVRFALRTLGAEFCKVFFKVGIKRGVNPAL